MLKQLDPHSTYLPPHEAQQTLETLSGKFDGIGIQINMLEDTLFVVQTVVGGPSEKAGILPATVSYRSMTASLPESNLPSTTSSPC